MKFLHRIIMLCLAVGLLFGAVPAEAEGNNLTISATVLENKITVSGTSDCDKVYIVAKLDTEDGDRREGYRYFASADVVEGQYSLEFSAFEGGDYTIKVSDSNDYADTRVSVDQPVLKIDGGGTSAKIALSYYIPSVAAGSTGTLKFTVPIGISVSGGSYISAENMKMTQPDAQKFEYTYEITGVNPKVTFEFAATDEFSGDTFDVTTTEFTLKTAVYNDVIACEFDANKSFDILTQNEIDALIKAAEDKIDLLPEKDSISAKNYTDTLDKKEEAETAINNAKDKGVEESAFDKIKYQKYCDVAAKLAEIKDEAEALLAIIAIKDPENRYDKIKDKNNVLKLNSVLLEKIDASGDEKDEILTYIAGKDCYSTKELAQEMASGYVLEKLKVTDYENVQALLDLFETELGVEFPVLSESIRKSIEKREFKSIALLKEAVDNAVSAETGGGDTTGDSTVTDKINSGGNNHGGGGGGGGSYTAPTISVDGTPTTEQSDTNTLKGIDNSHWAYEYVAMLNEKGVMTGDSNGDMRPDDPVTRAEFVKMLVLSVGIDGGEAGKAFSDVDADDWYYEYVNKAVGAGIVNGIGDGYFGANDKLSRQDMVVLICRAMGLETEDNTLMFTDKGSVADYAKDAVAIMQNLGFVNGFEDGSFRPNETASRSMVAKLLCKLMEGGEADV